MSGEPDSPPAGADGLALRSADDRAAQQSAMLDYYEILGVDPTATQETIALAYRRLAARYCSRSESQRLKLVNVAYAVLGNPARRADYDRQRFLALPAPAALIAWPFDAASATSEAPPRWTTAEADERRLTGRTWLELAGVLTVVAVAAVAVLSIIQHGGLVDPGTPLANAARSIGLLPEQRVAATAPTPGPTAPAPAAAAGPTSTPTPQQLVEQFAQTTVDIQPLNPRPGTEITVTTTVRRNGQPVPDLPLHLVAHFRTVDERWPPGSEQVATDESGTARISFNIGNATRGYTVKVDVIATVDGQELVWHGAFTPR